MIKASDLTIQTLGERFNALPEKLQSAIQSEENLAVITSACKNNLLADEEKIEAIEQLVALVILGFIPLDALAREIDENLHLNNLRLTSAIAGEINNKVFAGIKKEVEANYNPPKDEDEEILAVVEESVVRKVPPPAIPPRPTQPPSSPLSSFPLSSSPLAGMPVGEFAKLGLQKMPLPSPPPIPKPLAPTPPVPPATPVPSKVEGPAILHKEESFLKPVRPASGFGMSISIPKSLEAKPKEAAPLRPAVLELGITPPPPEKKSDTREMPRVVHYTEYRTPLKQDASSAGNLSPAATPATGRDVREITASPPPASPPPSSPNRPTPPTIQPKPPA